MKRLLSNPHTYTAALLGLALAVLVAGCAGNGIPKLPEPPVITVKTAQDFAAAKIGALEELKYLGNLEQEVQSKESEAHTAKLIPDSAHAAIQAALISMAKQGQTAVHAIDTDVTLQRYDQLRAVLQPIIDDANSVLAPLGAAGTSWRERISNAISIAVGVLLQLSGAGAFK